MGSFPFINHVEMAYSPGHKDATVAFFELLGFRVIETGAWITAYVDPANTTNWADNIVYANEAIPAQDSYEAEYARVLASDGKFAAALGRLKEVRQVYPQFGFHFGIAMTSLEEWQARVDRMRQASLEHPLLAGHIEVITFEPGNPLAVSNQSQAYMRADFLSTEGYTFGIQIELQWTPVDEDGNPNAVGTGYFPAREELT